MKKILFMTTLVACFPMSYMAHSATDENILTKNPVYLEFYTRNEDKKDKGLQGLIGRIDFVDVGVYFAPEITTDTYYEYALGKTWHPSDKSYIDIYLARTPWNNRVSLRTGYTFDNGISLSFRVRPEFGFDNWEKPDTQGNNVNYGKNVSVRTDMFIAYNTKNYEFFYNRVDMFETDDDIANNFHYGDKHFQTDHEFRITYTANKWRPYFQYTFMYHGYDDGKGLKNDNRWQVGFALPM